MHVIYQALSYLLIGGLLPVLFVHPKLRNGIRRRLGIYPAGGPFPPNREANREGGPGPAPRIWFHGASAGDLVALVPILSEVRRLAPNATLIVSTMTNSGYAIARDRIRPLVDAITLLPYDLPGCTTRALRAIRPDLLVLEYAEIWPNLIHAAKKQGAKVAMTNGRISEALLSRYRFLQFLIGNQLEKFDLLLMREEVEAERARVLGAASERVAVTGNTKFDNVAKSPKETVVAALRHAMGLSSERVFVAGSTHDGEERDLFRCFCAMRKIDPRIRMIVAPRYVERGPRVAALARAEGLSSVLRSEAETGTETNAAVSREVASRAAVMVLDSMGELLAAYSLASLVFVGGSFVPRGGQNILEPAGQGKCVLFGPNMANFRDSVEVLLGRGGIQVQNAEQLEKVLCELLVRWEECERLGTMAKAAVNKSRGASLRNAELLLELALVDSP